MNPVQKLLIAFEKYRQYGNFVNGGMTDREKRFCKALYEFQRHTDTDLKVYVDDSATSLRWYSKAVSAFMYADCAEGGIVFSKIDMWSSQRVDLTEYLEKHPYFTDGVHAEVKRIQKFLMENFPGVKKHFIGETKRKHEQC